MKPSIQELRYQCRIDSDDDAEDVMLELYLNASLKHAEKIVNRHLYDDAVPDVAGIALV